SETSFSRSLPAEGSAKFKKACLLGAVLVVWAPLSREVRMGTRIVLLSDGTGNSAAKVWRTNVWRVFEALDLTGSDQIACYDDGVGTSSFKPLAVLGGAFGWGLKRNVMISTNSFAGIIDPRKMRFLGLGSAEVPSLYEL